MCTELFQLFVKVQYLNTGKPKSSVKTAKMEVMEDGNLMDKLGILIKRDMEYYQSKQAILQQTVCPGVMGGKLDFPRSASFASIKLVQWWEEEYVAAYKRPSGFFQTTKKETRASDESDSAEDEIVKNSDPPKFMQLVNKSSEEFLDHLHVLTQEALDHADLSVLTGTIGAAALLKNYLWFYIQTTETTSYSLGEIQKSSKRYNEMCEALAERLLDLYCRLISLYILQDAECLDWECHKPFFESERGSYTIQMWWAFMQGTKEDLWNTVPPKMAQRVFSGMLNESLTILTVRYTQSCPSESRSRLVVVDIFNLLLCVAQLLPSICESAKDLVGIACHTSSKIFRDIHMKCQELYTFMLLRSCSLDDLSKAFRKNADDVEMFKSRSTGPCSWIIFALPHIFKSQTVASSNISELEPRVAIALELMVLLAQPQPNWTLLLKVLCMRQQRVIMMILTAASKVLQEDIQKKPTQEADCGGFLCCNDGTCKMATVLGPTLQQNDYYNIIHSAVKVSLYVGNVEEFQTVLIPIIIMRENWTKCFDRKNVWNQIRPPWFEAMVNFVDPLLKITSDTVGTAVESGASMYQAMALTLACLNLLWDCVHPGLKKIADLLQTFMPFNVQPLHQSCLLQIVITALYSKLLNDSQMLSRNKVSCEGKSEEKPCQKISVANSEATFHTKDEIFLAVAEALCSVDEDNKHTDQIEEFLENTKSNDKVEGPLEGIESTSQMADLLASDILMTDNGKCSLKTLFHFVKGNKEWIYQQLGVSDKKSRLEEPNKTKPAGLSLTHTMFHIGYRKFDELLTGECQPNWLHLLQTPMGLIPEKVWSQLSSRWDFRNAYSSNLPSNQNEIISYISSLFKQIINDKR